MHTFTVLSHRLVASQGKNGLVDPKEQHLRLSVIYVPCSRWSSRSEWSTCVAVPPLKPGLFISLGII